VVEADPVLAEALRRRRGVVLVQADERAAAQQVDGVVHVRVGVLVDDGLGLEQRLVPGDADRQVTHRQRHVGQGRELGHGGLRPSW
jgi:hypothetical protein